MLMVSIHLCHEGFTMCEPDIRGIVLLLQVIRFEVTICHKASHV